MYSFDTLLHASSDELIAIFAATRAASGAVGGTRREQLAQELGVKVAQLVCGVGFNAAMVQQGSLCRVLGYADHADLVAERNYVFIHDVYSGLSINNIIEIYAALPTLAPGAVAWSDLVLTRIGNIEAQLEETINPILIGGYKLEIRAIYDNHLASPEFVYGRLTPNHAVMRDIANENAIMLERGAIDPRAFLEHDGVSADEKRRVIFQGLVPPAIADHYIRQVGSEEERARLREALSGSPD